MDLGSVSVVIPNRNRKEFLARAIASVAKQTVKPGEIIVVDDGSNADELRRIEHFLGVNKHALNIIFIKNNIGRGANYCRNIAINMAKHEYIAFLDSDDLWLPEKLAVQMSEIRHVVRPEEHALCTTGRYRLGRDQNILAIQSAKTSYNEVNIRETNFLGPLSSAIVSTKIAREIGGFNQDLPSCQDWDFFIRLAGKVKHVNVPRAFIAYYDHDLDRISLDQKSRIIGLKEILRRNSEGFPILRKIDNSEIYRSIAEAYQINDDRLAARIYYLKHLACRSRKTSYLKMFDFFKPLPNLKMLRYDSYQRKMARLLKDGAADAQLARDRELIEWFFTSNCV